MPTTDLKICSLLGLALKDSAQIVVVDHSEEIAGRIQGMFPDHHINSRYVGDGAVRRFIDGNCDYVAHWWRDGFPDGQQHLSINGNIWTRPWAHDPSGADSTQDAVNDLERQWPSAGVHCRPESTGEAGVRFHVSRLDYQKCPDPWGRGSEQGS